MVQVGDLQLELGGGRQELVQRRVHQAHGDRQALHRLEDALEVGTLDRQQAVDGGLALFDGLGEDHLLHDRQAVGGVEHALGAAQADAHGAELARARRVLRRIGVGHHLEAADLVGPLEQRLHVLAEFGLHGRHLASIDVAVAAVDGDDVALVQRGVADGGAALDVVDVDRLAAGHAGLAHAARDHRRVRGLAAARGQDALRLEEAVDVLGLGLLAHQDDHFAVAAARFGAVGVEDDLAGSGARRSRKTNGQRLALEAGRQLRHQQLFEHGRIDAQQRLLLADQAFLEHLDRGAHHRRGVHLAVARLQAVERAALDGEFEVLHFLVVRLEAVVQFEQLPVDLRHVLLHLGDRLRRADAGHHVFALGVDEVLAVDQVLAGARVAREADAGARIVAHVAEHHRADVAGGAVGHFPGDLELLAVVDRALAVP